MTVIFKTYSGKEAETILAKAEGYMRMQWEILNGNADRDPAAFLATCKHIGLEQANKGA